MSQIAVVSSGSTRELKQVPVPKPGPGEVLVKNVAVASNPKDWKYPAFIPTWEGVVEGNDVAGYVHELGEGVSQVHQNQRVRIQMKAIAFLRNSRSRGCP